MSVEEKLMLLVQAIQNEARVNEQFRLALEAALGAPRGARFGVGLSNKRPHRRKSAAVDPVAEMTTGEDQLRARLRLLDLEQLRDVVAEYRMDSSKLVMKWKDKERVIEHILAMALARTKKGDAFRR